MSKSSFEIINEVFKFLASIAIIFGVVFAYQTLDNRIETEKKRLAIDAVSRFSDKWFMDSYLRVLEGFDEELMPGLYDPKEIRQLYNDLSIVLNVINSVAILYENELADRCIIKRYAENIMEEFSPVLDNALAPYSEEFSERFRENFNNLKKGLEDNVCDQPKPNTRSVKMKNLFPIKNSVALSAILMISGFLIGGGVSNVSHADTILPPPETIQDFEQGNGTPGQGGIEDYCHNYWFADCKFELENTLPKGKRSARFPESKRALRIEVGDHDDPSETGGTVRILPSSEVLDLSKATSIHLWVYDTQGNNTIELKLCNGGNCPDSIWSTPIKSRHNTWKKITWPVSKFENVDKSRITGLEIYEWNSGIYYIDDIGWEQR